MKKFLLKFKFLLLLSSGLLFNSIFISCNQDKEIGNVNNKSASLLFREKLNVNFSSFMNTSVVLNSSETEDVITRAGVLPNKSLNKIYIDLEDIEDVVDISEIKTPGEILNLINKYGAQINCINDGTYTHELEVSEIELIKGMTPLILSSKNYLYLKGFSENEIQEMLSENGVDESLLVPLVLFLMEEENHQSDDIYNYSQTRATDLQQIASCAIKAIGFDIGVIMGQSTLKTWSKTLIKKTFKTVAAKLLGPIGVTIALIDFSICMWA